MYTFFKKLSQFFYFHVLIMNILIYNFVQPFSNTKQKYNKYYINDLFLINIELK